MVCRIVWKRTPVGIVRPPHPLILISKVSPMEQPVEDLMIGPSYPIMECNY